MPDPKKEAEFYQSALEKANQEIIRLNQLLASKTQIPLDRRINRRDESYWKIRQQRGELWAKNDLLAEKVKKLTAEVKEYQAGEPTLYWKIEEIKEREAQLRRQEKRLSRKGIELIASLPQLIRFLIIIVLKEKAKMSFRELGQKLGMSRQRAHQCYSDAKNFMRLISQTL